MSPTGERARDGGRPGPSGCSSAQGEFGRLRGVQAELLKHKQLGPRELSEDLYDSFFEVSLEFAGTLLKIPI